jgi:hypothetical protein
VASVSFSARVLPVNASLRKGRQKKADGSMHMFFQSNEWVIDKLFMDTAGDTIGNIKAIIEDRLGYRLTSRYCVNYELAVSSSLMITTTDYEPLQRLQYTDTKATWGGRLHVRVHSPPLTSPCLMIQVLPVPAPHTSLAALVVGVQCVLLLSASRLSLFVSHTRAP